MIRMWQWKFCPSANLSANHNIFTAHQSEYKAVMSSVEKSIDVQIRFHTNVCLYLVLR